MSAESTDDVTSAIYIIVKEALTKQPVSANGEQAVSYNEVENMVLMRGRTSIALQRMLQTYEKMQVLTVEDDGAGSRRIVLSRPGETDDGMGGW